jgi:L-lactate utilization protein LutC
VPSRSRAIFFLCVHISNRATAIEKTINVLPIKCTEIYAEEEYTLTEDTEIEELGIYVLPEEATNKELTYEIEDETVAKIEGGKIVVLKNGITN